MIIQNLPCIKCQEMGYDKAGTNLVVFEDGGQFCNRSHKHKNGSNYYCPPNSGSNPILDSEVTGTIRYTEEQFKELEKAGKLDAPTIRGIALAGMSHENRYKCSTNKEKELIDKEYKHDIEFFNQLQVRDLVTRHISGHIAKYYNVRVGLDVDNKVNRHYYPRHTLDGELKGAKCRNLPKDFRYGSIGKLWGKSLMFGQHKHSEAIQKGARVDTLLLVGGECDVMAAQQMLKESRKETKWSDVPFHIWSTNNGEHALQEIIDHKDIINKFSKIILCFDADDVGEKLTKEVAKLFRQKAYKLELPADCKDVNECLKYGKSKEFVDAWWKPVSPFSGGNLNSMQVYKSKAKETPTMGLSWPWSEMNPVSYGIRLNSLHVVGAGTGCGKTKGAKEVAFHIAYEHNQPVVVIYLEEQPQQTVRSFSGQYINKELTAPPVVDKKDQHYIQMRDYSEDEANKAIDKLCDDNMILIGDLEGRKDITSVMEVLEEAIALGYQYFIIDNLTAFEHKGKSGNDGSVQAIDETMRAIGTLKDENPIFIYLLSHLSRPYDGRKPHEEGSEVRITDFRGSNSISYWANQMWSNERNTKAKVMKEKCLTLWRNLKNRDAGYMAGTVVGTLMDLTTGKLNQTSYRGEEEFDDGTKPKPKNEEEERDY